MPIDPRQKALWLYELRLNGFVMLRNFLPLDLIESMRVQIDPLLLGETARLRAAGYRSVRRLGGHLVATLRP